MRVFYYGCKLVCLVGDGIHISRTVLINFNSIKKYYYLKNGDKK